MSVAAIAGPIASRQHGAFHLRQVRALSVTRHALARAVESGEIERLSHEVYVVSGSPPTWRQRLMVAVLDAGPGACASHRSAALLLDIARLGASPVVEITTPRTRTHRLEGVIVHRLLDLTDDNVLEVDGIPCAGPLRTLVDIGAVEPVWEVRDMLERCLTARLVTIGGVEWAITQHSRRGRTGVGVLRRVVDDRALFRSMPDSVLEARMARIFRQHGLPGFAFQHVITDEAGGFVARVDFAILDARCAFEVNGWEKHGTPAATGADYERIHRIEMLGWRVRSFTYWDVVKRPAHVARVIREVLGAAGPLVAA